MDGKRKKPPRTNPLRLCGVDDLLQKGLHDRNSKFGIDNFMANIRSGKARSVSLRERLEPSTDLLAFGRRSLEVAAMRAADAEDSLRMTEILDDWGMSGSTARRASAALDVFLNNLSAGKASIGAAALLPSLRQMAVHTLDGTVASREKWALEQATALLAAQRTLRQMHSYMVSRRRKLALDRKNPGEPVKAAFIATMAEAWVFLTGKLPGSGPSRNPFLRFAETAWQDLDGRADASFVQALRTSLQSMKADEHFTSGDYRPHWL